MVLLHGKSASLDSKNHGPMALIEGLLVGGLMVLNGGTVVF